MLTPTTLLPRKIATVLAPAYWREAALGAPAFALLLAIGVAHGDPASRVIAAGAAFSVGFGAARSLGDWRWGAMIVVTAGMAAAAFFGTLAGQDVAVITSVAALLAAGCAAVALYHEDFWWIFLQVVIAFLVAGYYPNGPGPAAERAAYVAAGGAIQLMTVVALARLFPSAGARLPSATSAPSAPRLVIAHMLRAAASVAVALLLARRLGLENDYWAPMTALLVLKPGLFETQARGRARFAGTVAGCLAAFVFVVAVGAFQPFLVAAAGVSAYLAYALQKAHYALLTSAVTITVVLLFTLLNGDVFLDSEHRLYATLLGGGLALAVSRIAPHNGAA